MPALRQRDLLEAVMDAISRSSASGSLISTMSNNPRIFTIGYQDSSYILRLYIWTLTHGGRRTLPNEYRIQITSVTSPLITGGEEHTALMGYMADLDVFAGFDLRRHSTFTGYSPSVQIDLSVLNDAIQNGIGFGRKENNEIAIGVRPDFFVPYVLNASTLHLTGSVNRLFNAILNASSGEESTPEVLDGLSVPRRRVVAEVSRLTRNANFRLRILAAYENRCAVFRSQLALVDAAHILPVAAPNSIDHETNGIALSPTYHRAFDAGLIYLDDNLEMQINDRKLNRLRISGLADGIEQFSGYLGRLFLPRNQDLRPSIEFVRQANRYRMIF